MPTLTKPALLRIAAFAAIYLIWGSTYLVILFAIETLPPFFMAGIRFLIGSSVLYAIARARGQAVIRRAYLVPAMIGGALFYLGGQGSLVWAEQYVPSGVASLIVAAIPLWLVVLDWMEKRRISIDWRTATGLLIGFFGVFLLIGWEAITAPESARRSTMEYVGFLALIAGSICWAAGSLYSRRTSVSAGFPLGLALQMLFGGVLLWSASLVTGEMQTLSLRNVSGSSWAALVYLVIFGTLIANSAYVWLLQSTPPAVVGTYAYVNPLVAVLLGWVFAGEQITGTTFLALAAIVVGVVLVNSASIKWRVPRVFRKQKQPS